MRRSVRRWGLVGAALGAVLLGASAADAGSFWCWLCGKDDCPPPASYSPARYWAPGAARINDYCHGPKISVDAPDRHPEIPVDFVILTFPCPPALPAETFIPVPTPPPESKFRYFERTGQATGTGEANGAKQADRDKADKAGTDKAGKDKPGK
jgi:hypothetical protein